LWGLVTGMKEPSNGCRWGRVIKLRLVGRCIIGNKATGAWCFQAGWIGVNASPRKDLVTLGKDLGRDRRESKSAKRIGT